MLKRVFAFDVKKSLFKKEIESSPFHNGSPLVFIVDHIDGIFTNNNPENIRAICPNCNSQTDTFSGKNMKRNSGKRYNTIYRS